MRSADGRDIPPHRPRLSARLQLILDESRMVVGSAGRNDSPRPSQNTWNIAPSAFCARRVFAEYAPSAIPCHSRKRCNNVVAGCAGFVTTKDSGRFLSDFIVRL